MMKLLRTLSGCSLALLLLFTVSCHAGKTKKQVAELPYDTLEAAETLLIDRLDRQFAQAEEPEDWYMEHEELIALVTSDTTTLRYDFRRMQERDYLRVSTSEDGQVRFYSWNTHKGGSMIYWGYLIQYRSSPSEVRTAVKPIYLLECPEEEEEIDRGAEDLYYGNAVLAVHAIRTDSGTTVYLAETYSTAGGYYETAELYALQIVDGELRRVPLFFDRQQASSILIDGFLQAHPEPVSADGSWGYYFRYDPATHLLHQPAIAEDGQIEEGRSHVYRFNGERFDYIGIRTQ